MSLRRRSERLNADNPARIDTVVSLCPEELLPKVQGITCVWIPVADAQPIPPAQPEETIRHSRARSDVVPSCLFARQE